MNELKLRPLDWDQVLGIVQNSATSGSAKLEIARLQAFDAPAAALARLDDVFDAMTLVAGGLRPHFESLDLFEPWWTRLKRKAVLKTIELRDVRSFCLETLAFKEAVREQGTSWAGRMREGLMLAEEPLSAIDQIMTPGGDIRSDASEKLFRLFREKEQLNKQIQSTLDGLVNNHQMQTFLQDKYVTTREGRWVLPIRSGSQHFVGGVIHGSSQTKQTVFMEPEAVIPLNNRLRQVEVEIEDEIERLLTELSEYLATKTDDFAHTKAVLLETDVILAQAQWSLKIGGEKFAFHEREILLHDVKHPLLVFHGKDPVANSVRLDEEQSILLLSGPNAGGKTVLMKSIGLCGQLARCGMPIPVGTQSHLPFFREIVLGIGDSQSVGQELSTFAAHLKILETAAGQRGPQTLILIDEICGSTDPEEGSALARAFIERMAEHSVFAVITSHLSPLKGGWPTEGRVMNGSLEYDRRSGHPTYQFIQGVPGDSLAIETARRVGIDKPILERAIELLSPSSRLRLEQQSQIDQMRADVQVLKDHLNREMGKAKQERERFEKMKQELEREKDAVLAAAEKEARKKVDELISLAKAEQAFKKHTTLQDIKRDLPQIIKPARPATAQAQLGPTTAEEFGERYPPGTKVYVPSLKADGLIQSAPNGKGEILVLSNSIRMMVSWKELKPPSQGANPTAQLVRQSSTFVVPLQDQDRVVDLRGQVVEEALGELELQLDQAVRGQESRLKVIHGHGTEALKKAVRTQLSRSPYVTKWKAGSPEQGGDGVTWVDLKDN